MIKDGSVESLPQVGPSFSKKLEKLGILSISDLLFHTPSRYLDFTKTKKIKDMKVGEISVVVAKVLSIKNQYTKTGKIMQIAQVEDQTGKLTVVWFNQRFLTKIVYPGLTLSLAGELKWFGAKPAFVAPDFEILKDDRDVIHTRGLVPVYPETSGISSKWLRSRIHASKEYFSLVKEYLSTEILDKYGLVDINTSLKNVHEPKHLKDIPVYKKRLAMEELIALHFSSLQNKSLLGKYIAPVLKTEKDLLSTFRESLSYGLTGDQESVIDEILQDLNKKIPMNRLLEGDVGSGKTIVALFGCLVAFSNGFQSVIMAPTQILAEQHFKTVAKVFSKLKVRVRLCTGSIDKKDIGKTDLFVGTHALLSKKELFENVGFVVIDEQHKFGVGQRQKLLKSATRGKRVPHLLTMTATPIPRTVALTAYGDMDLSVIREKPSGRQKIVTKVVQKPNSEKAISWVKEKINKEKIQAYFVCPLIGEDESEDLESIRSVKTEFARLSKVMFPLRVGLLHGKLPAKEKSEVLEKFKKHKLDILVSTPVVEVGIDIPNACIMVIEGAEMFGLSSLHQLRGRVGRSSKQSYCLLFAGSTSKIGLKRLRAMEKYGSGFDLAEIDLSLRGPGEIFGLKQHGIPQLKIAEWQNYSLIHDSKLLSANLFNNPIFKDLTIKNNHFILAGIPKIV